MDQEKIWSYPVLFFAYRLYEERRTDLPSCVLCHATTEKIRPAPVAHDLPMDPENIWAAALPCSLYGTEEAAAACPVCVHGHVFYVMIFSKTTLGPPPVCRRRVAYSLYGTEEAAAAAWLAYEGPASLRLREDGNGDIFGTTTGRGLIIWGRL
ncbi:hypothetical protein ACRALDRAFT_208590 [Sodiomyces alcalophilus JCM 7366]|uniref:uncharacterized protein n=1 Tax=Sodiomyces alcalophilus JCM 7366 TaxID=591952 RepID=UPI0039B6E048